MSLCARLGDCSEIVHELILGHANTRILDRNRRICLVRDDFQEEVRPRLDLLWTCDGSVADLVDGHLANST